jgi:hypothetical protein
MLYKKFEIEENLIGWGFIEMYRNIFAETISIKCKESSSTYESLLHMYPEPTKRALINAENKLNEKYKRENLKNSTSLIEYYPCIELGHPLIEENYSLITPQYYPFIEKDYLFIKSGYPDRSNKKIYNLKNSLDTKKNIEQKSAIIREKIKKQEEKYNEEHFLILEELIHYIVYYTLQEKSRCNEKALLTVLANSDLENEIEKILTILNNTCEVRAKSSEILNDGILSFIKLNLQTLQRIIACHLIIICTGTGEKTLEEYIQYANTILAYTMAQIEKNEKVTLASMREIFLNIPYILQLTQSNKEVQDIAIQFFYFLTEYEKSLTVTHKHSSLEKERGRILKILKNKEESNKLLSEEILSSIDENSEILNHIIASYLCIKSRERDEKTPEAYKEDAKIILQETINQLKNKKEILPIISEIFLDHKEYISGLPDPEHKILNTKIKLSIPIEKHREREKTFIKNIYLENTIKK